MIKVKIDQEKCTGCGVCASIAENFFEIDDESGLAKLIKQPTNQDENQEVEEAIEMCSFGAINKVD